MPKFRFAALCYCPIRGNVIFPAQPQGPKQPPPSLPSRALNSDKLSSSKSVCPIWLRFASPLHIQHLSSSSLQDTVHTHTARGLFTVWLSVIQRYWANCTSLKRLMFQRCDGKKALMCQNNPFNKKRTCHAYQNNILGTRQLLIKCECWKVSGRIGLLRILRWSSSA